MIKLMKELSVTDIQHGEIIAVHDFLHVLEEELRKFGISFENGELPDQEFLHTDEAIKLAAAVLQSSALVKMLRHGFTAMLPQHA